MDGSLGGYSPRGRKELNTTERLLFTSSRAWELQPLTERAKAPQ